MPLRVGFDLDGTVADMYDALHREAIKLFGEEVVRKAAKKTSKQARAAEGDGAAQAAAAVKTLENQVQHKSAEPEDDAPTNIPVHELHLTARQQMQLWDHVKKIDNFWTTLPELEPGIIARIAKTARERRWEIIFLTTRPSTAGDLVQLQSQRWLHAHGFQHPSVFVVQRSRGKIADALHLDAFVDDRPENCLDIAVESKAKVILIWPGDLKDVPAGAKRLGVRPVNTISEAMGLLEQLDDIRSQPGLIRSLKRAFGRDNADV
jgi:phosphoglycolate phosphatase-like HAD superfamily hydrolase